jgi:hypothetical protein
VPEGLSFDGTNRVEMSGTEDFTEDFTAISVAVWARNDTTEILGTMYIGKGDAISGVGSFTIFKTDAEAWQFRCESSSLVGTTVTSPSNFQEDLLWHFIVGTWDGAVLRLYSDGVEVGTSAPAYTAAFRNTSENITLGDRPAGGKGLSGDIGSGIIWSRALSPSEIQQLYEDPYALIRQPSKTFFFDVNGAGVPPVAATVGILGRGRMPGILGRFN